MQSQQPIRKKTTEYICFNAMHHFFICPFFCFRLPPRSGAFVFFFLHTVFFFYDVYFFLYLYLALFPWELFRLITSPTAIHNPLGHSFSACSSFLFLFAPKVSLFCWCSIYVVPFSPNQFDFLLELSDAPCWLSSKHPQDAIMLSVRKAEKKHGK